MNPEQADQLAKLLRRKRESLHLSASEVARRAGVDTGTITRIELGQIASPRADNLAAIAEVLDISRSDIFTAAGWVPETELPTLRPYLRAKYNGLTNEDAEAVERYIAELQRKHGAHGPINGEDEH